MKKRNVLLNSAQRWITRADVTVRTAVEGVRQSQRHDVWKRGRSRKRTHVRIVGHPDHLHCLQAVRWHLPQVIVAQVTEKAYKYKP